MRGVGIAVVTWALLGACGRIGYDELQPDAGAAESLEPFPSATPIPALADPTATDDDPTVTADLLELYFESTRRDGIGDLFVSRRASPDDPWGPPELVDELSISGEDDETPEISADGLTMYFARVQTNGGGSDFYVTTRSSRDAVWSPPTLAADLSTPGGEGAAAPLPDLLGIFLHALPAAGVPLDLYEVVRASVADPWGPRRAIAELNTAFGEATPYATDGGLTLYFASDRPGGAGGYDLYVATRPTLDSPFAAPVPVTELNTAGNLTDPWLSPDLRYVVFSDDGGGTNDLYEAQR